MPVTAGCRSCAALRYGPWRPQRGAFILTVALTLLFLLGFIGLALDFGRLFVIRSELQTALDSCALAAARELDGSESAITRAQAAGLRAGNFNRVNFQQDTPPQAPLLAESAITFRDAANASTASPALARYARCAHVHAAQGAWLLPALDAFTRQDATAGLYRVGGEAIATRASAQTSCPLPVGLRPKTGAAAPDHGFLPGDWVVLLSRAGIAPPGQIGWANLDGSSSAQQTVNELRGSCGTRVGDTLGTPGVQASVADEWNRRFGIYKSKGDASASQPPDLTGYVYTRRNWRPQRNAYAGPTPAGAQADPSGTAENYKTKAAKYASCADTSADFNLCESITGLTIKGGFKDLASPGWDPDFLRDGHHEFGASNRRVVTVPVVNASNRVIDYACMLMLQPLSIPVQDVQLEFIGNAGAPGSPCTTSGLPGGGAGPLVPVLVR